MRLIGFAALASSAFVPAVVSLIFVALGIGFVGGIAYAIWQMDLEHVEGRR